MTRQQSVMLAAGGTGGHLFPAFALAEELVARGIEVDLVTDMRGDKFGTNFPGRKVYQVPSATLTGRSPIAILRTLWSLGRGTLAAHRLLGRVKPGMVIGFGGYPTFPPLVAAWSRGIPSGIHEQNAVLGRANRMLAKIVNVVATSFETTKYLDDAARSKVCFTGNPVRNVVQESAQLDYQMPVDGGAFKLLVFGGSQGARFFADMVPLAVGRLSPETRTQLRVVQQARSEDAERVRSAYRDSNVAADVAEFFSDLPQRMADAHLIIARAGASTIAELTVIGRPSILVPLPHALDNDQLHNAKRLADSGGAWCMEQNAISADGLARMISDFYGDPAVLEQAARAAKLQGRAEAVKALADEVERGMRVDA